MRVRDPAPAASIEAIDLDLRAASGNIDWRTRIEAIGRAMQGLSRGLDASEPGEDC